MDLHLVSGFLGSGKTTSIVAISKMLMHDGKKVGVITNDQGKYLVDTAFINASDIPAVDVQSGCFCSHYKDFIEQIEHLKKNIDPDIIFAESIGSAGNLVGTVIKPLLQGSSYYARSLSTLADARLLLRLCKAQPLPFSDSVNRLFVSQMNESDCLIVNKIDLLTLKDIKHLKTELPAMFNDKNILFQSAYKDEHISNWYRFISGMDRAGLKDSGLDENDRRRALERLKWYERRYRISCGNPAREVIEKGLGHLLNDLKKANCIIAHIKCFIRTEEEDIKISIIGFDDEKWKGELQRLRGKKADIILNARLQADEEPDCFFNNVFPFEQK
jgi:G3E family GTPase